MKYLKVMFGNKSGADKDLEYKIGEVNVAENWNPKAESPKDMGGFNFSNEENILRWLVRGDTIYDVSIPEDAEVIVADNPSTPNGVFRSNKIILNNPRVVTDEVAMELYEKSKLPEKTYYKALIGLALRGHYNTCLKLIKDKINKDNIKEVLNEVNDFLKPNDKENFPECDSECVSKVKRLLEEIDSDLLISMFINKDPYHKMLTSDKVINITGESGSGKSTYVKNNFNSDKYLVIDTDVVFGDRETSNEIERRLQELIHNKFTNYRELLCNDFDTCYKFILDNLKDIDKTIVIDSAQYRNIKDINLLKGEVIVIRTSIDECYNRCIRRYSDTKINATEEELIKYKEKKKGMYTWYLTLNTFLERIEKMENR